MEYITNGVGYMGVPEQITQVVTKPNGAKEYQVSDHLASLRVAIEGSSTRTMDYDPWGNPLAGSSTGDRETFNGQERDKENGLYDLSDRNYDPASGSFPKADRLLWQSPSVSPYVYCNANPLRLTDPTGRQAAEAEPEGEGAEEPVNNAPNNAEPTQPKRESLTPEGQSADPDPPPPPMTDNELAKENAKDAQRDPRKSGEENSGLPKPRYQPGRLRVDQLKALDSAETSGSRPDLEKLSDDDLLEAVRNPKNNDPIKVSTEDNLVKDGNGRAYELLRRALNSGGLILPSTTVPVVFVAPNFLPFKF